MSIPSNWTDPLLTGPKAVIGKPPYTCQDIERLLNAIRPRVDALESVLTQCFVALKGVEHKCLCPSNAHSPNCDVGKALDAIRKVKRKQ